MHNPSSLYDTALNLPKPTLACSVCGAEAEAACDCNAPYVPAAQKAAEALALHPERSDRSIAAAIGVSDFTVRKIRQRAGLARVRRVGKDGRLRSVPPPNPQAELLALCAELIDLNRRLAVCLRKELTRVQREALAQPLAVCANLLAKQIEVLGA
jgi:hypothetical protein